jgi:hypothetical protein
MKNYKIITAFILLVLSFGCNEDEFLERQPKGSLSGDQLLDPNGAEALVTAAYAGLATHFSEIQPTFFHPPSNWSFGDMRSDDAYKGGGGTGDISEYHALEIGSIFPENGTIHSKWLANYYGVARTNKAISALRDIPEGQFDQKEQRIAEMKVLRGHFYFDLIKHFHTFPYLDETIDQTQMTEVGNNLSREELWTKIEQDFSEAIEVLPENTDQPGRVNKFVAHAYLAKAHLFQQEWSQVLEHSEAVLSSGKYFLFNDFTNLWNVEFEHGPEIIFGIEFTINDGSDNGNINWGNLLNAPRGPAYNGDGFHRPSQNLVNAYKVDENGLPLFDTFNDLDLVNGDPVDPRLDHTIGRLGIPWKDFDEVYTESWARNLQEYGPYAPKKYLVSPNSPFMIEGWPWGATALNWAVIKVSDVMLWKAEALIELNQNLDEARSLINAIRIRAKNSPYVQNLDGSGPAANYSIGLYPEAGWTQDYARQALQFERRLELALEGHRFYDLVRWGIDAQVLNTFYEEEALKRSYYGTANFVDNKHEYLPVPQAEIDRAQGIYQQYEPYQ